MLTDQHVRVYNTFLDREKVVRHKIAGPIKDNVKYIILSYYSVSSQLRSIFYGLFLYALLYSLII